MPRPVKEPRALVVAASVATVAQPPDPAHQIQAVEAAAKDIIAETDRAAPADRA